MIKRIVFSLTIFLTLQGYGQEATLSENFKADFGKALDKKFNTGALNKMFHDYSSLLTPHSDVTQLFEGLKGQPLSVFPLYNFKSEKLYTANINSLINSANPNQRLLSYLVVAASYDTSKESMLLAKLKTEKEKGNLIWAGMALLYLKSDHTTELFDFLVEHENFGDAHMIPLYFKLNADSLRETAYDRYNSKNINGKILAIQMLSKTGLNPKTEKIVLQAIQDWDYNIKGYAIYSAKELQIGNLTETFIPLLDSQATRRIALEALANSPTKQDQDFLFKMATAQDTISNDLLDAYFNSKKLENKKIWLNLITTGTISPDYYFSIPNNTAMYADELLIPVQTAVKNCKNEKVLAELLRALQDRKDSGSLEILIDLLSHKNSEVRYWSATSLKGNQNPRLQKVLPELIKDEAKRTTALVELLIENNINNLQDIFENIYTESMGVGGDWQRSSVDYLSNFPLERDKVIFRTMLINSKEDFFVKNCAAMGLGKLKDTSSVDLLIRECEESKAGSDFNARSYLIALGMIKGDRAKTEIEKFKNSKEEAIAELVKKILDEWPEK